MRWAAREASMDRVCTAPQLGPKMGRVTGWRDRAAQAGRGGSPKCLPGPILGGCPSLGPRGLPKISPLRNGLMGAERVEAPHDILGASLSSRVHAG